MKKSLFIFCLILPIAVGLQAQNHPAIFFLVRHAEKQADKGRDPELSEAGKKRARSLAERFKNTSFGAIYSTDYARTRSTAQAVSEAQNVEITLYKPFEAGFIDKLKEKHPGQNVLIVGHSNTVPQLVNELCGEDRFENLRDDAYDNLFEISFDKNRRPEVKIVKFGKLSPAPDTGEINTLPADVASPEAVVAALYDVISGPKGQDRDRNRMRSLFAPEGRLQALAGRRDGSSAVVTMKANEYIDRNAAFLKKNGFFQIEIAAQSLIFGDMVHVFSSYEARYELEGEVFMRGINSIQLAKIAGEWKVVNIFWNAESPANPIPEKFLKKD